MKTFYPRQHPGNARVFTALLITFMLLMTPVMPFAAANARAAGYASPLPFAPYAPAPTTVTATKTDSFPDPDNDGKAEPGQTITYDVNVANSGAADATGVNFTDTIDPNTTLVPGSLRVSPLAFADSYNATLNTPLSISAPGVLGNDTGTPAPTAQPIAGGPTTQGGTVTLNANGSFTYNPPNATFQGADTFTYTATNGLSPNDSATVTINVDAGPSVTTTSPTNGANNVAQNSNITINFTEPVNATTGSFSVSCAGNPQTFTLSASPSASFTLDPSADLPAGTTCTVTVFATGITDADNFDPPDQMAADYVFSFGVKPLAVDDMHAVTGNVRIDSAVSGYSVLANDQAPGATISAFDATSVHGGNVTMNTGTGTFTYDPPRGFTGTDSFNYTVSNGGGSDVGTVVLTVTDMIWFINNAAGACSSGCDGRLSHPFTTLAAFDAIDGNGTTVLGAVVDPEAGDNIFIYGLDGNYTGPLTLENNQKVIGQGAPASIAAITGIALAPDSDPLPSTGGTAPNITTGGVAVAGITLAQNDQLHGISMVNTSGTAIRNTPTAPVGNLLLNTVTVSNTTTGAGITLNAGGTVEATGINSISTSTGSALNVLNTNIGPLGMTFRSISSSGGTANGIILNNTGTAGGLTVTGNGTPGSGGTIQNKTGVDANVATQGTGVFLNSTSGVSLSWMQLNGFTNFAVRGTGVTGFSLANSVISGVNGSNAAINEGSVSFSNLATSAAYPTAAITNSDIGGGKADNIRVVNTAGTLNRLAVTGTTVRPVDSTTGNDGLHFEGSNAGTVMNMTVSGSTFKGARSDMIEATSATGVSMDIVVRANSFTNEQTNVISGQQAIFLQGSGTVTYDISCNKLVQVNAAGTTGTSQGNSINISKGTTGGNFSGTIFNNTIGKTGVQNSGAGGSGAGIVINASGTGTHTALVKNNVIRNFGEDGILVRANSGNSTANVTVVGNVTKEPNPLFGFTGLFVDIGAGPSDTNVLNLRVGGSGADQNDLIGSAGAGASEVEIFNNVASTQINLARGVSGSNVLAQVFDDNNVGAPTVDPFGTITLVNVSPSLPAGIDESCSPVAALDLAPAGTDYVAQAPATPATNAVFESLNGRANDYVEVASLGDAAKYAINHGKPAPRANAFDASAKTATGNSNEKAHNVKAAPRAATLARAFSGETINASIGTLQSGKTVHVQFQVTVDNPFPTGVSQVSNQGTVSGDNFAAALTDDPAVGGSADPTVTQILTPPDVTIKDSSVAEPATGSAPMAFAVTLSHSYTQAVTVNYSTASGGANPATAGTDYTTTSGTLTFNPGETVQTISVPVLADGDNAETNETFLVNISGATGGATIADSQAVGTITPVSTAGTVLISELRTSGPAGADDEFVEILNNTDSPITVAASDASGGWAIVKSGSDCNATPVVIAVIPNGTVIPARGNYLVTGSAYSLGAYAAGDAALILGIEDDRNVALFNTADLSNISTGTRLDAVGFGSNVGGNCDLLREGTTLADAAGSTSEYSFVRKVDKGDTQDTNDNAADFIVVSTTPAVAVGANATPSLGAPGPENSTGARGPVPCNVPETAKFGRARLDSTVALGSSPNTVRDATVGPNAANGTIDFRRRFTNNTGGAVTQLRFRITNTNSSSPGAADLRALSSSAISVGGVNDPATCGGPGPCTVSVVGTTLEQPPTQTSGGGINSTLGVGTITLGTPLASGSSVNLHLLFGVQTTGNYHLSIVIETATSGSIGQDEWELRGNTEDGGASASEGGCNTPPVANAGADQTIECGGGSTAVTLDGTASSDPDGDTLTYEWREGATVLGTTAVLNTSLPFGPHTITLKVTDPSGDFSEDTVSINIVDTTDPMITAPPNVTVNTGPGATSCGVVISNATLGSANASDGCSTSVTVTRTGVPSGNNFPVGTTLVTYTADDGHGHTASAQQSVTVIDNTPPTLSVPANITVNAPANSCSANVDPGTATAGDNCPGVTVTGTRSDAQALNAPYPVGTTTITWKATDAHSNVTTGTQTVTVNDATPPTIVLTTNAISLGSPNHQYQTLTISQLVASASDGCDPSVDINDVVISQATSDEPEDAAGGGDGNTLNDIVIAPDCKSLQLRAERQGSGDGRVYHITLKVKDSSGNVATAVRTIVVPQSGPVVDSGVQYTVNGCTP